MKNRRLLTFFLLLPAVIFLTSCPDQDDPCPSGSGRKNFSLDENTAAGTILGSIDQYPEATSYVITSGNVDNAYEIDTDGNLVVSNSDAIDYEVNSSFELEISAEVAGCGQITFPVGIQLNDLVDQEYRDPVYDEITTEELVPYSDVAPEDQVMNVYWPTQAEGPRPLLVIAGGGAFFPSALGFLDAIGNTMAQAGYVVAAIRYISDPDDELNNVIRFMVGTHDIRAAVRFFRKDAAGENNYNIDPDNIFIGGFGTGAFLALQLAYVKEDEIPSATLDLINSAYGGLEGERGNPGFSSEAKALVSMAGAIRTLDHIDEDEIPLICIHATNDQEVAYEFGDGWYGSKSITERAEEIGLANKLVPISSNNHDAPAFCVDCYDEVLAFFSGYLE